MTNLKLDCVFIETTTACTRQCRWCVHHYYDIKPCFMTEPLFLKIVSELSEIDFSGRLSFYLNGEPLLDTRLQHWVNFAKRLCPNAFTFIITNGDLLTYEKIMKLMEAGLDGVKVNTYDKRTHGKVKEVLERLPASVSRHILHFDYSQKTDWTSRGGTVPVKRKSERTKDTSKVCLRPFRQLYITVNGVVAQCCSDALNQYIMGDINRESLSDIWHGQPFTKVRNSLMGKEELNELCNACDLERTYQDVDQVKQLFENGL